MVLIDMEKPLSCEGCRFCEYEQGHCTALPVGEWRQITDMSECPLQEQKTGKWMFCGYATERDWILGIKSFKCSVCDKKGDWKSPHCPNCGAEMEEE